MARDKLRNFFVELFFSQPFFAFFWLTKLALTTKLRPRGWGGKLPLLTVKPWGGAQLFPRHTTCPRRHDLLADYLVKLVIPASRAITKPAVICRCVPLLLVSKPNTPLSFRAANWNMKVHPKTLFEIAMVLSTNSGSFPSNSHVSATFSILLRFGESWNPTNSEKFNTDVSQMGRTNLDKSVW